jgi:hypothetical protein
MEVFAGIGKGVANTVRSSTRISLGHSMAPTGRVWSRSSQALAFLYGLGYGAPTGSLVTLATMPFCVITTVESPGGVDAGTVKLIW